MASSSESGVCVRGFTKDFLSALVGIGGLQPWTNELPFDVNGAMAETQYAELPGTNRFVGLQRIIRA